MKNKLALLSVIPLIACSSNSFVKSKVFSFDTMIEIKLYDGKQSDADELDKIFSLYGKLSDNYASSDVTNVYSINHTNDKVEVQQELYDMLKTSFAVSEEGADNFNPLCGSLAKKWKESLKNSQILDKNTINEEIEKINNSSMAFDDAIHSIQRNGEAEIDLGGIAKGYAIDKAYDYLSAQNIKSYLIDAGHSSILLGEKKTKDGLFSVGLNDIENAYIKLKNCFVSTSSNSIQGVEVDGVTYSHIINPKTGSALTLHDAVIIVSDKGYYSDAMSTSLMYSTIDEIKESEEKYKYQTIVVENKKVVYCSNGLEVLYR